MTAPLVISNAGCTPAKLHELADRCNDKWQGNVMLLNSRAVNWHGAQIHTAAVTVCHRPIAWLRTWHNILREIR